MRKKAKRRNTSFDTFCTVLITLLIVAIVFVVLYGWRTLGFSSYTVSYSTEYTDITGVLPDDRKFEPGDEVVVRAGSFTKENYTFVGWKDVDNSIEYSSAILENGVVFIMPESDVTLEAVWEENTKAEENKENNDNSSSSESNVEIFFKKDGKDYINVRADHNYTSEVVTKVIDKDTEIRYSGKSENVYDEDDYTTYTWYYVTIPELKKEGWIRSDMLSKKGGADDEESFLKSSKIEVLSLYKNPDSSSDIIAEIDDDETILYFNGETDETTDKNGKKVTWYLVEVSDSNRSGWVKFEDLDAFEN